MSWQVLSKKSNNRSAPPDCDLRITAQAKNRISIAFSPKLLMSLKWKVGDKVHLVFDYSKRLVGIQKTSDATGYAISKCHPSSKRGRTGATIGKERSLFVAGKDAPREFRMEELWIEPTENLVAVEML